MTTITKAHNGTQGDGGLAQATLVFAEALVWLVRTSQTCFTNCLMGAVATGPILFGFAFSWISATIGLLIRHTESVQSIGLIWVFPLVFAPSVFVPVKSMPDWLVVFSQNIYYPPRMSARIGRATE